MKYKREMYESNPNIVSRVESLMLVLHNCAVYNCSPERIQKTRDELEMWVDLESDE
jgi:hypothetical protein